MRQHGTRAAYVHGIEPGSNRANGCRCEACCDANRTYARIQTKRLVRERAGKRTPRLVDAAEVRAHLIWLSERGIGGRSVELVSGVSRSDLSLIRSGRRKRVDGATADRILQVWPADAMAGCYVPAAPTWRLIDDLLAHGYTREGISRRLGSKAQQPSLQLGRDRITARNARRVQALHEQLMADVLVRREQMRADRAYFRAKAKAS